MERKDQNKVLAAGFAIIRKADYPDPRIKIRTEQDWKTFGKYETKAQRDRVYLELLKDKKTISD